VKKFKYHIKLIDIICEDLQGDTDYHHKNTRKHKLVITGQEKTPVEVSCGGVVIQRRDIATTHEEADNIIVQQAMQVAVDEKKRVTVLADDTDVYALLLYHYLQQGLQIPW
jgi:carbonic anhydrase